MTVLFSVNPEVLRKGLMHHKDNWDFNNLHGCLVVNSAASSSGLSPGIPTFSLGTLVSSWLSTCSTHRANSSPTPMADLLHLVL